MTATRADAVMQNPVVWRWVETTARRLIKRHALSAQDIREIGDRILEQARSRRTE